MSVDNNTDLYKNETIKEKKYLEISTKGKCQAISQLQTKNPVNYLCKLLKVSKSGYYKWLNNGMKQFNKWIPFIANIIKSTFYAFKEIYGYNMICCWIKKIYKLNIQPHIVYRCMKNMGLKSKIRTKKFDYRLKSGSLRYDNLLDRNFATMKTEFLYQIPRKKRTIEWIKENLPKYIYFYNNHRPQPKLKGMSPIEYRLAHSQTNIKFIPMKLDLM